VGRAGEGRLGLLGGQVGPGVWEAARATVRATAGHALLSAIFLADQARLMTDAVGRTLWRLYVTRRHLLEWETADAAERRLGGAFRQFLRTMWSAPALAVGLGGLVALLRPGSLPAALPVLLALLLAPAAAHFARR